MQILYGDLAQLPDAQAQYQDDGTVQWEIGREDGGGNNQNTYQAIDRYNCGSWFQTESQDVPLVETFTSSETHRLGTSIVRCLRKVFPESFKKLVSKRQGDTLLLPVLFRIPAQKYKYSESGKRLVPETIRELTMFVHALVHVAIEVVLTMCCDTSHSGTVQILVMSFYKEWLSEFEAFLRCYLASACKALHDYCGIPVDNLHETCYSFEALIERKVLQLNNVWSLKGIDSAVAFLFVPRRSESDFGWHGRLLDLSGLRIAISRAGKRFYLFADDLSEEVWVSGTNRPLANEADDLHLKNFSDNKWTRDREPMVKKQLSWVRLFRHADAEMTGALDIPPLWARHITPDDWGVSPLLASPEFQKSISQTGPWSERLARYLTCATEAATRFLTECWGFYVQLPWDEHQNAFAPTKTRALKFSMIARPCASFSLRIQNVVTHLAHHLDLRTSRGSTDWIRILSLTSVRLPGTMRLKS